MNIFYLDRDPAKCAMMHCDKHVVKMILEYAQLLSTAHHLVDGEPSIDCYKPTHKNHPSAVWVRESRCNYQWLYQLLDSLLLVEYTFRYGKTFTRPRAAAYSRTCLRFHTSYRVASSLSRPSVCQTSARTTIPVVAYRNYYVREKSHMARWKNTDSPPWYKIGTAIELMETV